MRLAATAAHNLLKALWFVRRPKTFGAHAVALTPGKMLVLVKLRYAPAWRLPGGGRAEGEDPRDAALRELREEIGMGSHGEVQLACELQESTDFKRDTASLVIVRDVDIDRGDGAGKWKRSAKWISIRFRRTYRRRPRAGSLASARFSSGP